MAKFQARKIPGRWRDGYALDLHTLSSTPLGYDEFGHMQFETTRSEVGELLYKLKFNRDKTVVPAIVEALEEFMTSWKPRVDAIVPVPPSSERPLQPVIVLARALSRRLAIPLVDCVKKVRETPQLKNVTDLDERLRLLKGLHHVDRSAIRGKKILLFDDLYRSGATMNAITDVLYDTGGAAQVFALAVTRTRSHR
jgi:competence protein ComFC